MIKIKINKENNMISIIDNNDFHGINVISMDVKEFENIVKNFEKEIKKDV